jgi:uncharacterized membrane protein
MNYLMISMRIIHIFAGVFWAGTSFFMISFVSPAVIATGAEGQKFMQQLAFRTRFTTAMMGVAILTVLSGLIMYWQIFNFRLSALSNGYGLMLTLGAIAGFIGFLTGYFLQNRTTGKMKALSDSIAASGGPPTPEQQAEMKSLSETVTRGSQITSVLLALALLGMSVAQYVFF